MPQEAIGEISRTVAHFYGDGGSGDLARFIRLEATDAEYMLYATSLGGDFVLATSSESEEHTRRYFHDKGFTVVLPYRELILE